MCLCVSRELGWTHTEQVDENLEGGGAAAAPILQGQKLRLCDSGPHRSRPSIIAPNRNNSNSYGLYCEDLLPSIWCVVPHLVLLSPMGSPGFVAISQIVKLRHEVAKFRAGIRTQSLLS